MDSYVNLSRETLIHEIKQLNKTIEALKFNQDLSNENALDLLNMVKFPVLRIGYDYDILWANEYAIQNNKRLYHQKCYQALFDFEDICENCKLKEVIERKLSTQVNLVDLKNFHWQISMSPLQNKDHSVSVLEFQMPISMNLTATENIKETISTLRKTTQSQKEELDQIKEFIKTVSSRLLTPIKAIRGIQASFEKTYLSQVQEEYLTVLEKNSELLYSIFRSMLLNSKIDGIIVKNPKREFNLGMVVDELIKMTSVHYITKTQIDQMIPQMVFGDEINFTLAMYMLIESIASENDNIYIQMSVISETNKLLNVKIMISNFPDEIQNDFEKFNLNSISETPYASPVDAFIRETNIEVGKAAIEALGGTVLLSNTEGKKSQLTIFLSFEKVLPRVVGKLSKENSDRLHILFIDIEKPMVSLEMLQKYNIYFAKNLKEADDLFTTYMPNIIVVNMMLEQEDGFTIFDVLSKHREENQFFIATSNPLIENEREFMLDYGFDEYFEKPLSQKAILEIIRLYNRSL